MIIHATFENLYQSKCKNKQQKNQQIVIPIFVVFTHYTFKPAVQFWVTFLVIHRKPHISEACAFEVHSCKSSETSK